jgi:hypothetical protein
MEYAKLMQNKDYIDQVLLTSSEKARQLASDKIKQLRKIVGID